MKQTPEQQRALAATELPYDRHINPVRRHKVLQAIWHSGGGWRRLASVNHSDLGIRFMLTAAVFFGIGGLLSMLIRAQLATPDAAFVGPDVYNQLFTMHGTVMMFLFAIPLLEGIAIYLLPKLLGTRDLAFPRLTAFGYWCYLFGGSIIVCSLLLGVAPDSGWFMYTPLSSNTYSPGINADVWLIGITFVEISAMAFAVEVIVSILKLRAPGMSLAKMPIMAWYVLGAAAMMLVGFPPLILGSVLLELERAAGLPFFDPTRGGSALLWQHLFWLFGHPEVYIILLPAVGTLSTIIPVFARRPLAGYVPVVVAIVAMVFLSMGIWVHHMFTVGIPHLALAFFSLGSVAVAVPTAVQVFAWLGTLATGKPRWRIPMLYVGGFFMVFVCGGLTGVMLAIVPFNTQAHDSYFVVAHLHYVLVGGMIFPLLAALYYWLPHITGRMPRWNLAVPAFWVLMLGFNATFLLMHLTGLLGMPRRVYTYAAEDGWTALNLLSSIGGFVLTMGFAMVALDVFLQLKHGRRYRRDPWDGATLEWAMPTPPTAYAFSALPHVDGRADQLQPAKLGAQLAAGDGYLAGARNGWQETLAVETGSGKLQQLVILPRSTFMPLLQAASLCVMVLSLLLKLYPLALLALLVAAGLFVFGARDCGLRRVYGALPVGRGQSATVYTEADSPPPLLAVKVLLIGDASLLMSLLFGTAYLWFVGAPWVPSEHLQPAPLFAVLLAVAGLTALFLPMRMALRRYQRGDVANLLPETAIAIGAIAMSIGGLLWLLLSIAPNPSQHAAGALVVALIGYALLHLCIGLLFVISTCWRQQRGYVCAVRNMDIRMSRTWLDYSAATGLLLLAVVLLLPVLGGVPA